MDITNTIHDIIMGQVDDRLEPARVIADKTKEALQARENALREELRAKMQELAKEADRKFRAWLAKRPAEKRAELRRRWAGDNCAIDCVFSLENPEHFVLPFDSRRPREVFDALRREVLQRALRVASEHPSRTAYAAVDELLAGINPVTAYRLRAGVGK